MSAEAVIRDVDDVLVTDHALNADAAGRDGGTWCGLPIGHDAGRTVASDGKPVILGVGERTCPRCVAERKAWADANGYQLEAWCG